MAYRTIAAIVTDQEADRSTLAAAARLAGDTPAHLDVYCLGIDQTRFEPLPAGAAGVLLETGAAEARDRAETLAAWARETLSGKPTTLVEPVVMPHMGLESGVARMARYADLIVCARPYGRLAGPLQVAALEAALFGTGAPVLVVGADLEMDPAPRRVLLAWDESPEALTAMRHALPLLTAAEHVDVVMVDPPPHSPERSDPGGALCIMLSRHGVRAEVSILSRTLPRVSDCLIRFAREHGCDLIVMGAYGHSRLREAMLGGPTRDMLEAAETPLFIAH